MTSQNKELALFHTNETKVVVSERLDFALNAADLKMIFVDGVNQLAFVRDKKIHTMSDELIADAKRTLMDIDISMQPANSTSMENWLGYLATACTHKNKKSPISLQSEIIELGEMAECPRFLLTRPNARKFAKEKKWWPEDFATLQPFFDGLMKEPLEMKADIEKIANTRPAKDNGTQETEEDRQRKRSEAMQSWNTPLNVDNLIKNVGVDEDD